MQQQGREIQAEGTESTKVANTFAEQQEVRMAGQSNGGRSETQGQGGYRGQSRPCRALATRIVLF